MVTGRWVREAPRLLMVFSNTTEKCYWLLMVFPNTTEKRYWLSMVLENSSVRAGR